jgi:hypothetical protein
MKIKRSVFIKHHISFFIIIFLSLIVASRIFGVGPDYNSYKNIFSSKTHVVEPFFSVFRIINLFLFNGNVYYVYLFTCFLALLLKFNFFFSYAHNIFLSLLFYICTFFFLHEYTQIRVAVAIGIFFVSIKDIIEHKPKHFLLKTIIACMFHYSSIIMIIIYIYCNFTNKKRLYIILPWLFFLFAVVISIFVNVERGIQKIVDVIITKNAREQWLILDYIYKKILSGSISNEILIFNKVYLSLLCISTFIYYIYDGFKDRKYINDFCLFKVLTFSVVSFFFFLYFASDTLVFRVSEYSFLIILAILLNAII